MSRLTEPEESDTIVTPAALVDCSSLSVDNWESQQRNWADSVATEDAQWHELAVQF